jgi:hypothetical protein
MTDRRVPRNRHDYREAVLSVSGPSKSTARLVAIGLTMDMDAKSMETFVSAERLAERTGLSERAVRVALAALKTEGWITERTQGRGRNFWLKVRTAAIPSTSGEAAFNAGSDPAPNAGSRHPAPNAGHPARSSGDPAQNDPTPCIKLQKDPAPGADYPGLRSRNDPEQDPGGNPAGAATPSPAAADFAAPDRRKDQSVLADRDAARAAAGLRRKHLVDGAQ